MIVSSCKNCGKRVHLQKIEGKTYSFDDMCCWDLHECSEKCQGKEFEI